ncbi:MAG: hypothetical protein ACRD5R_06055 [Candidatus Acidiferrales bacterium]
MHRNMIVTALAVSLIAFPAPGWTQSKAQRTTRTSPRTSKTEADQLGLSCAQILKMTSTEWIEHFVDHFAPGSDTVAATTERAIDAYGKCYDARTGRLAAMLKRSGKSPLMGAMGNFRDFEQGLQNFTALALADSQPAQPGPQDAQKLELKTAYAKLYQKQFRYAFYQGYEKPPRKPTAASKTAPAKSAASPENQTKPLGVSPGGAASKKPESPNSAPDAASSSAAAPEQDGAVNFSKAKNHFGELIGALPEEKSHPVHAAFGAIFGANQVSEETRLAVYLYAIFTLEPTSDKRFAPPPF